MSTQRTLFVVACLVLSACTGSSSSSPTASASPKPTTVAAAPSSAVIVLHETPDNLGCDSIGIDYTTMTFHIDVAAAEQVSAMTDTGVSLVTYWPAGFKADTAGERVVRDTAGQVVATDGEVLRVGRPLHGYGVCPSTSKLHVMLPGPTTHPSASVTPTIAPTPTARATERSDASGQPSPAVERCESGWAVTIVDTLRVRSQPNVGAESIKYEPLLGLGTEFELVAGPVAGSGYWWYEIALAPGVLRGGVTKGWIPAGDRDGTPWIQCMGID